MSIEADITIRDNSDWTIALQFVDDYDAPHDFTGSTFRLDVKTSDAAAGASLSLTTANGGVASTDLANGAISLVIADYALAPGDYVYDLIRLSGTAREELMRGAFSVEKGRTGL